MKKNLEQGKTRIGLRCSEGCIATVKHNGQKGQTKVASPRQSRMAKKGHPQVHCSEAVLRRNEDTVHSGPKFLFCSENPVFVHR